MRIELGYRPAASTAERKVQRALAWEPPRLASSLQSRVPRWSAGPTWTPPSTILLVRHRSLDGRRCVVTNDRNPPKGFAIEYDLGLVHCFAQPGTHRLVAREDGFFCTPFEGQLVDGLRALGYVETAPLPMLDALELRRDLASGRPTLVAGPSDPLFAAAEPLGRLGFIESYPLNPREAPDRRVNRQFATLLRWQDEAAWRHRYGVEEQRRDGAVALGGVARRPLAGFVELRLEPDGRLSSALLPADRSGGRSTLAAVRWTVAPLAWAGRAEGWALRASANRLRRGLPRLSSVRGRAGNGASIRLGYVAAAPREGSSPLFAATHPVLGDQYVTRSELEARDMGYAVDGILGYAADYCADRSRDALPAEVKWASRFGKQRRYVEGPLPFSS